MSAFKNVIKRKIHKERSQPYERQKLGLLEKKKDYRLRAKDYHRKEDTVNKLKEKASLKNPDEFYFKMNSSKTVNGIHTLERNNEKDDETLRKWKEQDVQWLNMKHTQINKRVEQLRSTLHNLSGSIKRTRAESDSDDEREDQVFSEKLGGTCNKRVIFADDEEEVKVQAKKVKKQKKDVFDTYHTQERANRKLEKQKDKRYRELQGLVAAQAKMVHLKKTLQTQKNLMGKGPRKKIVTEDRFGDEIKAKTVYKWKQVRKR